MATPSIAFLDSKDNLTTLARRGEKVSVHYDGYLTNGTKFDSSRDRGQPFQFSLGGGEVIRCWDMAVSQIPIGRRAKVTCPSSIAYGSRAIGPIPPNAELVFDIQVLGSR